MSTDEAAKAARYAQGERVESDPLHDPAEWVKRLSGFGERVGQTGAEAERVETSMTAEIGQHGELRLRRRGRWVGTVCPYRQDATCCDACPLLEVTATDVLLHCAPYGRSIPLSVEADPQAGGE